MTEGKIVEWLKQPGDKVGRGESVLVVESDKADMDVESFQDGFLAAVLMPAGSTAPVGETIGLIVETEAEIAEAKAKAPTPTSSAAASASTTVEAPPAAPAPSAPAPVAAAPVSTPATAPAPVAPVLAAPVVNDGRIVASPRAKKLASQMGVDLATVRGSGPHGRIQAEDVEQASGQPITVPRVAEGSAPAAAGQGVAAPAAVAAAAPAGNSFGRPGDTVPFKHAPGSCEPQHGGQPGGPLFPGRLHDHHRQTRSVLQAGEAKGRHHDGSACQGGGRHAGPAPPGECRDDSCRDGLPRRRECGDCGSHGGRRPDHTSPASSRSHRSL